MELNEIDAGLYRRLVRVLGAGHSRGFEIEEAAIREVARQHGLAWPSRERVSQLVVGRRVGAGTGQRWGKAPPTQQAAS